MRRDKSQGRLRMHAAFPTHNWHMVDLTLPLNAETPSPGLPAPEIRLLRKHGDVFEDGLSFQMTWFGMNDHTGTHMDAPIHFVPGGLTIDEVDISSLFMMPGVCLDFTPGRPYQALDEASARRALEAVGLTPADVPAGAFILLHTGHDRHAGTPAYFDAPFLTPDCVAFLASLAPRAIGVNAPTVDDRRTSERPIHRAILERNIAIIEGVANTEPLVGRRFFCTALPLRLTGCTGSPVRAVALVEE